MSDPKAPGGPARDGAGAGGSGDGIPPDADPLHGDPRVAAYFGERFRAVEAFRAALVAEGERRGLIGPREPARLWERHLLNSAAVIPFLPAGAVADVGSGAGLPGLVIAAVEPDREVVLIEPMERRVAWLEEIASRLGLANVTVLRARAESVAGLVRAPAVTARAVAPLGKLARWCLPLVSEGGAMLFLKGRAAAGRGRLVGRGPARPRARRRGPGGAYAAGA